MTLILKGIGFAPGNRTENQKMKDVGKKTYLKVGREPRTIGRNTHKYIQIDIFNEQSFELKSDTYTYK